MKTIKWFGTIVPQLCTHNLNPNSISAHSIRFNQIYLIMGFAISFYDDFCFCLHLLRAYSGVFVCVWRSNLFPWVSSRPAKACRMRLIGRGCIIIIVCCATACVDANGRSDTRTHAAASLVPTGATKQKADRFYLLPFIISPTWSRHMVRSEGMSEEQNVNDEKDESNRNVSRHER